MKKLIGLLVLTSSVFAQNPIQAEASYAFGKAGISSLSLVKPFGKKFQIGAGLRLTNVSSSKNINFETATASLIKNKKIDNLAISNSGVTMLNAIVALAYKPKKNIDLGFNIDALGLSFGTTKSGNYTSPTSSALNNSTQTAKPTNVNLLLVGNNDRGSLNSEFLARYWIGNTIGLKAGLNFQFVEYTTGKILANENDRFRAKLMQPMLGVAYKF